MGARSKTGPACRWAGRRAGRQSATALAVIHEKNIVHRDLKPENIFVVPDPVAPLGERVKLLDFGIAKFLDGLVRKTTVGMILGTPLYMSPERCKAAKISTPRSMSTRWA